MATLSSSHPYWHLVFWGIVGTASVAACGDDNDATPSASGGTAGTDGGAAGDDGSSAGATSEGGDTSSGGDTSASGGDTSSGGSTSDGGATSGGGGTTAPGPSCGEPDQACCLGDVCNGGACCVGNVCLAEGEMCPGGTGSNLCSAGACEDCGGNSQPCCGGPGGSCQPGYACMQGNICLDCGTDGLPCCADLQCSEGVCIGGGPGPMTCQASCGAPDQDCCSGNTCQPGLDCNGGTCEGTVCGLPGEACCMGFVECLLNGYECIEDTCQTCGAAGQVCCAEAFVFNDGCAPGLSCEDDGCVDDGCGSEGEPCCPIGPNGGCAPMLSCDDDDMCVAD